MIRHPRHPRHPHYSSPTSDFFSLHGEKKHLPAWGERTRQLVCPVRTARYRDCLIERYVPVCQLTGTRTARYRVVSPKSVVGDQFQSWAVNFGCRQSIEGERRRGRNLFRRALLFPDSPARSVAHGRFFDGARRNEAMSPHENHGLHSFVSVPQKSPAFDLLSRMLEYIAWKDLLHIGIIDSCETYFSVRYDPRKRITAAQALEHE
ncbi:hypothetical protein BHM03_00038728 [Ensete ventricosum]|uniref:Uncharacterized protein n=1 Tax=Ensete ventricosum TaxID=4639 RepID=A0A445MJW9_ENSVE|nr:hypothetical protein BHM03_00038728 [Ensete ventricosum]